MTRLLAAAAALVALTALAVPAVARQPEPPEPRPLVIAFVNDLAPGRPVPGAAVGALVVPRARHARCLADGFLTLSAGAPAALPDGECGPPELDTVGRYGGARVAGWDRIVRANDARHLGAHLGAFAARFADRTCVGAIGPYAALAAADEQGRVAQYQPVLVPGTCLVQVVDLTASTLPLDAAVRDVESTLRPKQVVLVGLPRGEHLGAVARVGPGGLLTGSTRRTGLVTLADLTDLGGTRRGSPARLADLDRREHLHRRYNGWYVTFLIALPLLVFIYAGVRRRLPRRTALVVATFPAAGFVASLLPWWRAGWPGAAVVAALVASALALAAAGAYAARRLRAPAAVGVATLCAAVLALDVVTGGRLQETGLASYSAIAGGRFYGIGNTGFAVLATCAVIALGAAANRWGPRVWLVLLAVVAVDALPSYGADFGGAVALVAAFVAAVAVRARRAAVVAGAAAGAVVALAVAAADYARPPAEQTHLGRFVGEVLHGGWSDTVLRKAHAATHSVTGTWYPLLVAGAVAVAVYLLRRLDDRRLDVTVRVLVVLWVAGSLVNDSGIAVAAVGLAVAVPLLMAYAAERT